MAFVHEFMFRGRAPGDVQPPAWHVILGDNITDPFGNSKFVDSGALTPAQAAAAGFPLPALLAAINTATMAQVTSLRAEVAQHKADLEIAQAALKAASVVEAKEDITA